MAIESNFKIKNGLNVTGSAYVSANVGIGQTSPQASVHVKKSSPKIRLEDTDSNTVIDIAQANTDLQLTVDSTLILVVNSTAIDANGTVLVANGSVTSPSITFKSDPNSGFYMIGADNLGVSVGGVLAQEFTETGGTVTTEFPNGPVIGYPKVDTAKTTSFTFALSEANEILPVNSASAANATIANNATVAQPIGAVHAIHQTGAGQVTWVAGPGVTLNVHGDFTLASRGQYAITFAIQTATDVWTVGGNLELV